MGPDGREQRLDDALPDGLVVDVDAAESIPGAIVIGVLLDEVARQRRPAAGEPVGVARGGGDLFVVVPEGDGVVQDAAAVQVAERVEEGGQAVGFRLAEGEVAEVGGNRLEPQRHGRDDPVARLEE